jgi:UDP-N-acetylmuramoyl-tripeptide--D-alanyl-D-alanine ligase
MDNGDQMLQSVDVMSRQDMPGFTLGQVAADAGGALIGPVALPLAGFSIDTRSIRPGDCFVAIRGPRFDGHDYVVEAARKGAAAAIVARDVADVEAGFPRIRVEDTVAALGRLAGAHRTRLRARVIAITGSNGKTTTKEMLAHILAGRLRVAGAVKSFNNAIGVPLTLLGAGADADALVVEAGTNHPGEIAALGTIIRPDVAVITHVGPSHLEGLGDEAGVAREKATLLETLREGGVAILNADNPWTAEMARTCRHRAVLFGVGHAAQVRASEIQWQARAIRFRVGETSFRLELLGEWNIHNALAASAAAREAGVPLEEAAERLKTFAPPPMRMEVREAGGVVWVNDAYNANPASSLAAIAEFSRLKPSGRRVVVFADMRELGPESPRYHRSIGEALARIALDCAVFVGVEVGTAAARFRELTKDGVAVREVPDADAAAKALAQYLRAGDMVLLKGSRAMGLETILAAFES